MLLDNNTLWADSLAYNGTTTVLDLGGSDKGPGEPIKCFITTESALTGATGIVLTDGSTSAAADALTTITDAGVAVAGNTLEFYLPSSVNRYVNIALDGTVSAGAFSAGIVMDVQTNK